MSVGIIWGGLVLCIFALKPYQRTMGGNVKKRDSKWAEIMINALFFLVCYRFFLEGQSFLADSV